MSRRKLTRSNLFAYAAPGVPEAMTLYCASIVIPGFYVAEAGLSTAFVGLILTLSRILDAVTDLGIGYLSDRTRTRIGARKPWLIAGTALTIISVWFLYQPGDGDNAIRFTVSIFVLYLGWSMSIIPYDAWGAELSRDYRERSLIFSYRAIAYYAGSILFLATPMLPIFETHAFTKETLAFNALLVVVVFSAATAAAVAFAPSERYGSGASTPSLRDMFAILRDTPPVRYYMAIYLLSGLSLGIFTALTFVYIVSYMRLGEQFSLILLLYVAANLLALPLWQLVLRRVQKHRAWAVGVLVNALCYPALYVLDPETPGRFWILLGVITLSGAAYSVANVVSKATLGDVADYGEMKSGLNRTANYFAIGAIVNKLNVAAGSGLAFLALSACGYDPASPSNDAVAVAGMKTMFLLVPALLGSVAAVLMWRFPIDERRHGIIRRRLERRSRIGAAG